MALLLSWRNVVEGEAGNPCSRVSEGPECCEYLGQILLASFGSVILVIIIINTILMVYSKFPIAAIGYKRKMVQRERRGFLRLESSLLMGAAAGEPAPVPPSLPSCLSPCPSPLPQASRGLSAGDPPRGTPTPTPSLADPEEADPKKGLRGDSRSLPHTHLCPPASQGQPAPPCGSPSPPTSLSSVAYNGGSDQEEMETDPPSPTPSLPHYPRDYHTSPSYRSSRPSPSLHSRATNSLVSPQPTLSLDSTRTAPSLISRRSYSLASTRTTPSLASTRTTPSLISRPTPSLVSSVPSQSLASSESTSPSPSSSPSPCPSVVQQDSRPPTSVGEEEESEQEGSTSCVPDVGVAERDCDADGTPPTGHLQKRELAELDDVHSSE
ncbi:uncharacterized protein [Hemitrygon akajei]|uniref:uncharacterized protein n=1 Tax=Hemitrygon akajei TaxID=2704970 RepID=UPI003BFA2817